MTALLLMSSVAMATGNTCVPTLSGSVSQSQSFSIGDFCSSGIATILTLTHGQAGASVCQSLSIDNIQSSPCNATPCNTKPGNPMPSLKNFCSPQTCGVEALQTQSADLEQDSSAIGSCAIINVNSFLDAGGGQQQFIGFSTGTKQQAQSLGLAAQQVLTRSDGAGSGNSTNDAELSQVQSGANAAGSVFESSTIDALQTSSTGGAANSTTALATSLMANTVQNQQVY